MKPDQGKLPRAGYRQTRRAQSRATTQAQNAQTQVGTQMGLTQAQQAKELTPYTYERDFLNDRMARETSLFNTANQNELSMLQQKTASGIALSEAEKARAQELLIQKNNYENSKSLASGRYISIGSGGLYDTQTGQIVSYGANEWTI